MRLRKRLSATALGVVLTVGAATGVDALEPASASAAERPTPADATVLALDKGSFVGCLRWKTPLVVTKEGKPMPLLEPLRKGETEEDRKPRPVVAADAPAKDWAAPGFDDGRWVRLAEPLFLPGGTPNQKLFYAPGAPIEWNLFCLRGMFRVEDPAQVRDLKLSLLYVGGARVLVNGQAVSRGHLPEGTLDLDTPAEVYPEAAYAQPRAKADSKELMKARTRELAGKGGEAGVAIPASMLRRGVNVVAIEVHAAPLGEVMLKENSSDNLNWSHAGVLSVRLSASGGVTPNIGPSQGIDLWTSQQMETDKAWHYALPSAAIRPIRTVGARNGTFSGKVVLSSAAAARPRTTQCPAPTWNGCGAAGSFTTPIMGTGRRCPSIREPGSVATSGFC